MGQTVAETRTTICQFLCLPDIHMLREGVRIVVSHVFCLLAKFWCKLPETKKNPIAKVVLMGDGTGVSL